MIHATPRPRRGAAAAAAAVDFAANRTLEQLESRTLLSGFVQHDDGHAELVEAYVPPASFVYEPAGALTGPMRGRAADVALNYLRDHAARFGLDAADLASPFVTSQYTGDNGMTYVYLTQEFNGLAVANSVINVALTRDNRVFAVGGGFVPGLAAREGDAPAPQLDARQALRAVAPQVEVNETRGVTITNRTSRLDRRQTLNAPDYSTAPVVANLQYIATPDGGVQLGWKMVLDLPSREHWYDLTASASRAGELLWAHDYYAHATYNILKGPTAHPHDPDPSTSPNRTLVTNPHDPVASPFGWHDLDGAAGDDTFETRGNNVVAQEDVNGNDGTGLRAQGGATNDYDFPLDLTLVPSGYQNASLTNLFYWNNLIHDVSYKFGFTPAARNFQVNNYGQGGLGNDAVQADGQDGSGINNANFGTPVDGQAPRMQMFLWNAPNPDRDGSLDNRIIVHEYTHGISNRLTGTGSGISAVQSRGMGEGWGDFLSLLFTQDPGDLQNGAYGVGTYALGQPNNGPGVRRFPYSYDTSVGPISWDAYGSGTGQLLNGGTITRSTAVHATGEIWCASLWDMAWNLINKHGYAPDLSTGYDPANGHDEGNLLAFRLVLDGMKLQPAQPSFTQARDAILAADVALTGGANQLEIWRAFARRGLGANASTPSSTSTAALTLDFNVPIADPVVLTHTPTGTALAPVTFIDFNFNQNMDQNSFAVADDVASFTGPGGADLLSSVTGFSWQSPSRLRVNFNPTTARGNYAMVIGPNILAADNGNAMDGDGDTIPGEPEDRYTANFAFNTFLGPEGFGYKSAAFPVENIDLVIGQPNVVTLLNGVNDTAGTITLPAGNTFNYYGTNFTQVSLNPNGLVTFGGTTTSSTNGDLTTTPTQASIAVLWDNWSTTTNGPAGSTDSAVLYKLDGNRLIIEWSDVPFSGSALGAVTFQAILQLNTGAVPGRIIANYVDLEAGSATVTNGAGATTGIKASGTQGTRRMLVSQNTGTHPWVGSGKAILYAPDVEAPTVTASAFNYLTSHAFTVTFNDDVAASIGASDLLLHNNTTNSDVDALAQLVSYDAGTNTATYTFPGLSGALLDDGNYTATIVSSGVTDAAGNPLDGDNDGVIGGNFAFNFFFLRGDANHDGTVNLDDFNTLAANFGQSGRDFSQGDFTYDGVVNLDDFNVLASRFGQSVATTDGAGAVAAPGKRESLPPPPLTTAAFGGGSIFGTGRTIGDDDHGGLDELA